MLTIPTNGHYRFELLDNSSLPLIQFFLLGIPHCLRQDDMYNGYHIPAGSIVYINLW